MELGAGSSYSVEPSDAVVLLPGDREKECTAAEASLPYRHPSPSPEASQATAAAAPSTAAEANVSSATPWTLTLKVFDALKFSDCASKLEVPGCTLIALCHSCLPMLPLVLQCIQVPVLNVVAMSASQMLPRQTPDRAQLSTSLNLR